MNIATDSSHCLINYWKQNNSKVVTTRNIQLTILLTGSLFNEIHLEHPSVCDPLYYNMICYINTHFSWHMIWQRAMLLREYTVRCQYNIVNFLQNLHRRHPNRWAMGFLKIQILIYILFQLLQWFIQYHVILDGIIMVPTVFLSKKYWVLFRSNLSSRACR